MSRQNSDTREAQLLHLSSSALGAREERVRQIKALVEAGLYRADASAIARAILRRREAAPPMQPPARSLDRRAWA